MPFSAYIECVCVCATIFNIIKCSLHRDKSNSLISLLDSPDDGIEIEFCVIFNLTIKILQFNCLRLFLAPSPKINGESF